MSKHAAISSPEITYAPEHSKSTKVIWRVFRLLLIITVVEVCLGLLMYLTDLNQGVVTFIKGVIIILGLVKSFYIISYFMHLGDEIRNFILTMVLPIVFILWGILALILDGRFELESKEMFDRYYSSEVETMKKQPATKHLRLEKKETHHSE